MARRQVNIDRVFYALSDATRRAMIERLSERPLSVSLLAKPFPITLAAVIQHLEILEMSGLVHTEKVGRVRTCRLEPQGFSWAEQWMNERRTMWEQRFDRLAELLAEDEQKGKEE